MNTGPSDPWTELLQPEDPSAPPPPPPPGPPAELLHRHIARPATRRAATLYVVSLLLPCASGLHSPRGNVWGFQALFIGAKAFVALPFAGGDMGSVLALLFVAYLPWWANVFGACAAAFLETLQFSYAALSGTLAVLLALLAFLSIALEPGGGSLGPGFYVWLASFVVLTYGAFRGLHWT